MACGPREGSDGRYSPLESDRTDPSSADPPYFGFGFASGMGGGGG